MVTMRSLALRLPTGIEQERLTSPLICTEQAPHCATPQPYLVPVSPACSRSAQSSGVSASAWISRSLPLMVSLAMCISLGQQRAIDDKIARREAAEDYLLQRYAGSF